MPSVTQYFATYYQESGQSLNFSQYFVSSTGALSTVPSPAESSAFSIQAFPYSSSGIQYQTFYSNAIQTGVFWYGSSPSPNPAPSSGMTQVFSFLIGLISIAFIMI